MKTNIFITGLLCLVMNACSTNEDFSNTKDANAIADSAPIPVIDRTTRSITDTSSSEQIFQNGNSPGYDWNQRISKTANVQTECKDYKLYNQQVHDLVRQYGGWVAAENEVQQHDRINNSLVIKVPGASFDDLLSAFGELDAITTEKHISSDDVTGRIIDTEGRIAVKKEIRDKYLEMLKRTNKIEDALKVQEELNNMHEHIEMTSTQLNSLKQQSSFSTINIHYFQLLAVPVETTPENIPGFGERLLTAAENGGSWLLNLFIGLVNIWPLLIGLGIGIFYIRKRIGVVKSK